ncbi:unannotated protein [freshwater metagenome]|uniref:Unannotated protein n=1 Tax=freshwater metagenome TaxID=449393 RepID=A0A6J7C1K2_9ZZZZ|nr:hypothetical protein [Actinomycetota bacterium]MSX38670.1 hypothetical protein [Actinomycetota bacterium]
MTADFASEDPDSSLLTSIGARFDHLAVAGPSLAALVAFYRDTLGGEYLYGEVLPVGAIVATFTIGTGRVELMAPTPGSSFFDRFFESTAGRGGVHHLTFFVDDVDVAAAALTARGIATFGLKHITQWSEVFIHPRGNGGVLVQLAKVGDHSGITWATLEDLLVAQRSDENRTEVSESTTPGQTRAPRVSSLPGPTSAPSPTTTPSR